MAEAFTTAELITDIKQRAMIPTDQTTFTASDLLRFATDELRLTLLPLLLSEREEFYLTEAGATQALVAGTAACQMPARAVGQMLRDAYIVDANGNISNLTRIEYDERPDFDVTATGVPQHFYLRNNKIVLLPIPSSADYSLCTPYYIRPSKLIETTAAAQITAVTSTTITVSSLPTTITTSTTVDFIRNTGGFECISIDETPTIIASTTLTFAAVPTGTAIGDWIALSGESPIPQLPAELHPLLSERTARKVMKAIGDANGVKLSEETIREMTEGALLITSNRVQGEPKRIVSRQWWR